MPTHLLPRRTVGVGGWGLGIGVMVALFTGGLTTAQEGHPLVGSWHGDRGATAKARTDITLVVDYDGEKITGVVNPGFESMALQNAT